MIEKRSYIYAIAEEAFRASPYNGSRTLESLLYVCKKLRERVFMLRRGTQEINNKGHLTIGGVDVVDLASEYGTPLYVYDTALIKSMSKQFQDAFRKYNIKWQVAYASKAFSTIAMVQLADQCGLTLDVVSGGELFTALQAGMSAEKIHFHGNNKSVEELTFAIQSDIGIIVVDNFYELDIINKLANSMMKTVRILLRMTPGVEAHTHEYIMTGQEDSKFGFTLENGDVTKAIYQALECNNIELKGLHCHIGSQIFNTEGFTLTIEKIYQHLDRWAKEMQFEPQVLNVGGGFGIRYTNEDTPLEVSEYIDVIVETILKEAATYGLSIPEIWVEPGRAIVGEAGTTLYSIGSKKSIPDVREYVSVDGGMADNLRPALYQAKYDAIIANKANNPIDCEYSVAGKCCESGDMLIWDIPLAKPEAGDVLAVFCTGAYGYSMANHYNRLTKPAVVFVEDGLAQLVVKRENYQDLIRYDLPLKTTVEK